jgi:hypothetical protein
LNKQHFPKPAFRILACAILSLLYFNLVSAQSSSDDFITITPDNVNQLELGYIFPNICGATQKNGSLALVSKTGIYDLFTGQKTLDLKSIWGFFSPDEKFFWGDKAELINLQSGDLLPIRGLTFSDDSKYASADDGVYELSTKKKLFAISDLGWFSPDSRYVAIVNDAIYEVKTAKKLYRLPPGIVEFSPDSQYFAVWNQGIYELATGKRIIISLGTNPTFSPNSHYVTISADGVYNIETNQRLITTTSPDSAIFSPDSKLVAIANDGVYELPSGKRRFKISGDQYIPPYFTKDSRFLVNDNDGVYDLNTNQKRYSIAHLTGITQADDLIITREKGIIETASGTTKFQIMPAYFAAHDKLVYQTIPTDVGNLCLLFGIKGDKWPYRSGLVNTSRTQIYSTPDGEKRLDPQGKLLISDKQLAVFAQTDDKKWLRVADSAWVKASDVQPKSLPEGIPIENPS